MPKKRQPKVALIKLGGSIITDKTVEQSVRYEVLSSLAAQLKEIRTRRPELQLVIAHGQGSFAHFPVKKYRLHEGFVDPDAQYGCAVAQDVVAQLNRIVVAQLLAVGLPAVSLYPSHIATARDGAPQTFYLDTLLEQLRLGLIPVLTGDLMLDQQRGSSVWSADFLLPYCARALQRQGWQIEAVIHVTQTPGVYRDLAHSDRGVIPVITPTSFESIEKQLGGSHGVDVTGGMLEKVRQAVALAKDGIATRIINNDDQALVDVVCDGASVGTHVRRALPT